MNKDTPSPADAEEGWDEGAATTTEPQPAPPDAPPMAAPAATDEAAPPATEQTASDVAPEGGSEAEPEATPEGVSEAEPEATPDSGSDAAPEAAPESGLEVSTEAAAEGVSDAPSGAAPEHASEVAPEAAPPTAPEAAPAEPDEDSLRLAEALVFASATPVTARALSQILPNTADADAVLAGLRARYAGRGVELVDTAGGVQFRTAPDLGPRLRKVIEVPRKLPRVAMETLAIIAYHQPCTRSEIEEIRGTSLSQQTLDALLEANLVAPKGRREVPGRPTLWGTTPQFLVQFGLKDLRDLPQRGDLILEQPPPAGVSDAPPLTPELGSEQPMEAEPEAVTAATEAASDQSPETSAPPSGDAAQAEASPAADSAALSPR